jgi:subtilisin family serine protease
MNRKTTAGVTAAVLAALTVSTAALAARPDGSADGRYIVKFRDSLGAGAAAAVRMAGGRVAVELGAQNAVAAYLPAAALEAMRNNPNVEYVEVDARRYPMAQSTPWGITAVQADDAVFTSSATAGDGTMVCIIDSGYQMAHEDLAGDVVGGAPSSGGLVTGTNDAGTGNWFEDSCGHGSHVAGTIAALDNSVGVVGVNRNGRLRLHIEKVFDGAACGWAYSSTLVTALSRCQTAAANAGSRLVVSMSLGGSLSSRTENTAFQNAYDAGVLPIAAAGNDGNTRTSYPAGYASVMSVAAVDSTGTVATFSQQNADVEIAAPGVGVVSTTPFKPSTLTVGSNAYSGTTIEGAATASATGAVVNGGLCDSVGAWSGRVVLCQRGTISFADKVANVKSGGGVGAAIYNNVSGGFSGTLGTGVTSTIPAISLSLEDGEQIVASGLGQSGTVDTILAAGNGYESYDGTSMATPHVSGVAALVWSLNPTRTNADVRSALQSTALDKGVAGRDNAYGFGIVQAKAANARLSAPVTAPTLTGVAKVTVKGKAYARLTWSGAAGSSVDYYRNATKVTTPNDGVQDDGPLGAGTYAYRVCLVGTQTCSATQTITY